MLTKENWEPVRLDVAHQLFVKFSNRDDINVVSSFCRAIRNRADDNWNDEILDMVSNIAINHKDPEEGKFNFWSSNDPEGKTVESLHSNALNCVRGSAALTIAALLRASQDRYDKLRDIVNAIVNDEHLAVNFSAIECIRSIMNIDREIATNWFFDLVRKDLRLVAQREAYDLFYHLFNSHTDTIKNIVLQMYESGYEDVSEVGARHIGNMNLLYDCFNDVIFQRINKTRVQKKGILSVAIDLLKRDTFHEKCKRIIELFIDEEEDFSGSFSEILYTGAVNVEEDLDFLVKLAASKSNQTFMPDFVDLIKESDLPIEVFKDIIFNLCQNIVENTQGEVYDIQSNLYGIAPELSQLIASLFDRTQDNFEVNQRCLDMWDMMFEHRIGTIRELSQSIMDC